MATRFLRRVRAPEDRRLLWDWPLPVGLVVAYVIATLTGLLMITTWREVDIAEPDAASLAISGLIGGLLVLWMLVRNVWAAILVEREEQGAGDDLSVTRLLSLQESQSRPLWIVWLVALSIVIAMDALALIVGKSSTDLPIGLDRIEGADWTTWLLAAALFIAVRPLAEELIFRGIFYPVLAKRLDDNLIAVIVCAVLYAGFYGIQVFTPDLGWGVTYWGLIYPLVLGLTAGLARAHTKSTWGAVGSSAMFGLFLILNATVVFA